jgi:hypothetical protein
MASPTPGLASQTSPTPGVSIPALAENLSGGYITNPITANGNLYVDPVGPASTTPNGTTMEVPPGQTFYAIPGSTSQVSVSSLIANHPFVSVQWV